MKKNFKSYSFWTALAGAVVVLLNALGDLFGFSVDNDLVKGLIMAVAGLRVVLGIVTMPNKDEEDIDETDSSEEADSEDGNQDEEDDSQK
mgnify:CR=1 FL=1